MGNVKKVSLEHYKILDKWSTMIENGQGKREQIYQDAMKHIQESKAPGINIELVKAKSSVIKDERDYLMVTNAYMKDYRVYIGATDYGKNLNVYWYLTCEPGLMKQLFPDYDRGVTAEGLPRALDVFEEQEINAYVTVVHHSLLKAVESLMMSLGQEPSRIDRKSRGFLGVT
jgi:hypothetical protein